MVLNDFRSPISNWRFLWFARRPKLAWVKPSFAIFKCLRMGTPAWELPIPQEYYPHTAVRQAMSSRPRSLLKWGASLTHGGWTAATHQLLMAMVNKAQRLRTGISKQCEDGQNNLIICKPSNKKNGTDVAFVVSFSFLIICFYCILQK